MKERLLDKISNFIYSLKPRVYNCRDVWLVIWRGREYLIKK